MILKNSWPSETHCWDTQSSPHWGAETIQCKWVRLSSNFKFLEWSDGRRYHGMPGSLQADRDGKKLWSDWFLSCSLLISKDKGLAVKSRGCWEESRLLVDHSPPHFPSLVAQNLRCISSGTSPVSTLLQVIDGGFRILTFGAHKREWQLLCEQGSLQRF